VRYMNKTRLIQIASLLPIASASLASAQPLEYTIQELPSLNGNDPSLNSNATGMNEHGHAVGISQDGLGNNQSIVWINGQIETAIPIWQGELSFPFAKGINNHGQVVGQGGTGRPSNGGIIAPMTWTADDGMWVPDPGPQIHSGWSWAINDSGQIGFDPTTGVGEMGIIDPIDGVREIGFPGGSPWSVWEINNNGVACGAGRLTEGHLLHAYRYDYDTDTITDLGSDLKIGGHSDGYGINENGDIAGWAEIVGSTRHPIVWAADGRMIIMATGDLGPGHLGATAEHINGYGTVVGDDLSAGAEPPIGWVAYDVLSVGLADVTTQGAGAGDPGFGVPDRLITGADINYYVNAWVAGDLGIADLTTTGAAIGDPGYGVPDGAITGADINYYVNAWVAGPVVATKLVLKEQLSAADQLSWTRLHPFEVNDAGQICGIGIVDGRTRGFLMTPLPND